MAINKTINVKGTEITLFSKGVTDYISLTDIAKSRNSSEAFAIINNWMRSRSTIEFIGLWEKLCNPDLNLSNSRGLKESNSTPQKGNLTMTNSPQLKIRVWQKIKL